MVYTSIGFGKKRNKEINDNIIRYEKKVKEYRKKLSKELRDMLGEN